MQFDFTRPVLDYEDKPIYKPVERSASQAKPLVPVAFDFLHFTKQALASVYEGETLAFEARTYRAQLYDRIAKEPTKAELSITDRTLILTLINRISQTPIVYKRFIEFLDGVLITTAPHVAEIAAE